MATILIVDDEPKILRLLQLYLEGDGHRVHKAVDGKEAISLFDTHRPDVVVLDRMLPGISGEEVCRYIRQTSKVPVLMLTAKSTEDEMIEGLELGAEDYVSKPFSPREFMARVRVILRREQKVTEIKSSDGSIQLDTSSGKVWVGKEEVLLTPTEYKLLKLFLSSPGRIYSKGELAEWALGFDDFTGEDSMYVHVKNLRQKMKGKNYIKTVYGRGYRFEVPHEV